MCRPLFAFFLDRTTRKYMHANTQLHINICMYVCLYIHLHVLSKIMNSHRHLQFQPMPTGLIFPFSHATRVCPSFLGLQLQQPENFYQSSYAYKWPGALCPNHYKKMYILEERVPNLFATPPSYLHPSWG